MSSESSSSPSAASVAGLPPFLPLSAVALLPVPGSACQDGLRKEIFLCDVGRQDVGALFRAGQRMQALIAAVVLAVACLNSYRLPLSSRLSSCLRLAHAGK